MPWRRIDALAPPRAVRLRVHPADGAAAFDIAARDGETLATALLSAGVDVFRRTAVSGAPRAPLCLMGVCFDCLVEVDGRASQQACMVAVRDGMQVRLPAGAPRAGGGGEGTA